MPGSIVVVGYDPTLANLGWARFELQLDSLQLSMQDMDLVQTEKDDSKKVRVSSDDLSRATEIWAGFNRGCRGAAMAFSEVPTGAQSSRAATSFGVVVGQLAALPIPLIQVMPSEVKKAIGLPKTGTKKQVIAWAEAKYPNAPWLRARGKADGALVSDNEHMADACAVVEAGILTPEFKRLMALRGVGA